MKKRMWVNHPLCNYNDRRKIFLTPDNVENYLVYEETQTNFNVNNGVAASLVTHIPDTMLNRTPNYLLIVNEDNTVHSRWYVIEAIYMSKIPNGEQYQIQLQRDVIADYKTLISQGIHKVTRGMLDRKVWSPILVQPETLSLNQVKVAQQNITSWDANAQWLTIFYDITASATDRTINFDWNASFDPDYAFTALQGDYSAKGFTINDSNNSFNNTYFTNWTSFTRRYTFTAKSYWIFGTFDTITLTYDITVTPTGISYSFVESNGFNEGLTGWAQGALNGAISNLNVKAIQDNITKEQNINKIDNYTYLRNKYDGRTINRTTTISRISMTTGSSSVNTVEGITPYNNALDVLVASIVGTNNRGDTFGIPDSDYNAVTGVTASSTNNAISKNSEYFVTSLAQIQVKGQVILPAYAKLDELNLGCITIPYGPSVNIVNNGTTYNLDETSIKSIFTTGWTNVGTAIKDIQILPYCPSGALNSLNNSHTASNNITITNLTASDKIPMTLTGANTPFYYAIACRQSSMDYRYPINLSQWFGEDIKLDSVTKIVRLNSHNHKASFEFNPTKNMGVTQLSFSYTLRPFNTIFRICPVFNNLGLYGGNYADSRGLIWEGGFSLSQVTDSWVEYKLNNSTYQSVFNRDIENLEVNQGNARLLETLDRQTAYQNAQTSINAATTSAMIKGTVGVAGSAMAMGANPLAGGAGLVGSVASFGSSMANINAQSEIADRNLNSAKIAQGINDASRAEATAYKTDVFALNNQAIMARPGTLSVNTDYSKINATKAYIEVYDCTIEEKQYIEQYFQFNGMRIDRIGSPKQFIKGPLSYFQSVMLFTPGLIPNIGNAINAELSRGIYVEEGLLDG